MVALNKKNLNLPDVVMIVVVVVWLHCDCSKTKKSKPPQCGCIGLP